MKRLLLLTTIFLTACGDTVLEITHEPRPWESETYIPKTVEVNTQFLFCPDTGSDYPNEEESKLNNDYLNNIGIPIEKSYQYVAPMYGDYKIVDTLLLNRLNTLREKPKYIMINLGSGVQEPLGYYLKQNLNFLPGIICTGAAISFFTGAQANISPTINRLGFGWLWRCLITPTVFIPRYLRAFSLFFLIIKTEVEVSE